MSDVNAELRAAAQAVDAAWFAVEDGDNVHLRYASDLPARLNDLRAALAATPEPGLDVAWAAAEDALPEGWAISELRHTAMLDQRWQVEAQRRIGPVVEWNRHRTVIAEGDSPATALLALAARLRAAYSEATRSSS